MDKFKIRDKMLGELSILINLVKKDILRKKKPQFLNIQTLQQIWVRFIDFSETVLEGTLFHSTCKHNMNIFWCLVFSKALLRSHCLLSG